MLSCAMQMILLLVALATGVQAAPQAWISFDDRATQTYEGTPYLWLGDAPIQLFVEVPPTSDLAVDLLWGAKDDQRSARVSLGGHSQLISAGGYRGFHWQRVALPEGLSGAGFELLIQRGGKHAPAFLNAVRVGPRTTPPARPLPRETSQGIRWVDPPESLLQECARRLREPGLDVWERAVLHGRQANEALRRCRKYVDGWLAHADPKSGLIPRNLNESRHFWNGRDAGADNYAFMVLTAALTDRSLYEGRMLDMLRTERRVATRLGTLPADFDFNQQSFRHSTPDVTRLIFDGSEYVKDGLMPVTEWLGSTPWSERMIGIVDTILEHAPVEVSGAAIPSDNVEVNGEMMQVLSRLCFRDDQPRYLEMACRIADYYLLGNRHPTRHFSELGLRDHNCELISGLTEVYAACHALRKDKAALYRAPLHEMLDRILEVGINEHGLMYDLVNPQSGEVLTRRIGDNWGYNYNGFYTVYLLDGIERYRLATRKALASLKPHYWKFPWQGWGSDGIADSVEGAINLFNREPDVAGVSEWIDANTTRMLDIQKPDGVIEGWHGDGNYARTAILWVLMKQQGVRVQPWREDVRLGAVREGAGIKLVVSAERPWEGRLIFDTPRHRENMKLPIDYPRINQFPEWFVVDASQDWRVVIDDAASVQLGAQLRQGLLVQLEEGGSAQIEVQAP